MSDKNLYLFSSESVSEGHPDKIADQISDAILDEALLNDPNSHVACETMIKNSLIVISGEMRTSSWVNLQSIVRNVIKNIGYTDSCLGLDYKNINVLNFISDQSDEISECVFRDDETCKGAGDQGIMFGFATDETPEYMPAALMFANKLLMTLANKRKSGEIEWLGPDSKSQVTVIYDDKGVLKGIDNVLISTQHKEFMSKKAIENQIIDDVIIPTLPAKLINKDTKFLINPSGSFIHGGPVADCGLTGRKIIVDAYGGYARHGGGAFSGKDPSKVDRSAGYMARYIAKNIVAAKLAKKCEIQLSYGIGLPNPLSISINTFGTSKYDHQTIQQAVKKVFKLQPEDIILKLNLRRPIYKKTSTYGHFGRDDPDFTWEKTDKIEELKRAIS